MDAEGFLRLVREKRAEKSAELRRGVLQNDMVKVQMALGGELVCDEIERRLRLGLETESRVREQAELRKRARRLGDFNRQKARAAA